MPTLERTIVDIREEMARAAADERYTVSEVALMYGVSRPKVLLSAHNRRQREPFPAVLRSATLDASDRGLARDRGGFPRARTAGGDAKRQRSAVRGTERPVLDDERSAHEVGCAAGLRPARP